MLSNASAVVENASFLFRSLYLPYEIPHWLYISKFTRLRTVFRRQHGSCKLDYRSFATKFCAVIGSCCSFDPSTSQVPRFWSQFRSATVTLHLSPHRLYPPWRRTDIISTHRKTQHNRHFIVQGRIELTTRWTRTGQRGLLRRTWVYCTPFSFVDWRGKTCVNENSSFQSQIARARKLCREKYKIQTLNNFARGLGGVTCCPSSSTTWARFFSERADLTELTWLITDVLYTVDCIDCIELQS